MTINFRGITGLVVYLAIGLLVYTLIYAPVPFDWTNHWVYIVSALWPFALLYELIVLGVYVAILILGTVVAVFLYGWMWDQIKRRKAKKPQVIMPKKHRVRR